MASYAGASSGMAQAQSVEDSMRATASGLGQLREALESSHKVELSDEFIEQRLQQMDSKRKELEERRKSGHIRSPKNDSPTMSQRMEEVRRRLESSQNAGGAGHNFTELHRNEVERERSNSVGGGADRLASRILGVSDRGDGDHLPVPDEYADMDLGLSRLGLSEEEWNQLSGDGGVAPSGRMLSSAYRIGDDDESIASQTSEDVHDRLFNKAMESKVRLEQARRVYRTEQTGTYTPEITSKALRLDREERVEDGLLRRHAEYKANREELRRTLDEEEKKKHRNPKITKYAQNVQLMEAVGDRLYNAKKVTDMKIDDLRRQQQEDLVKERPLKPAINPVSERMERSVDQIMAWEEERKRKRDKLKQLLDKDEQKTIQPVQINKRSEKIAQKLNRPRRVEDRLLQYGAQVKQKKEQQRQAEEKHPEVREKPKISVHSANIQLAGSVVDRLYEDGLERMHRRLEQDDYLVLEDGTVVENTEDRSTGQRLYTPYINPRSSALVRSVPIEERLMNEGERMRERKESRELDSLISKAEAANVPKVGPISELLVELIRERTGEDSRNRLFKDTKHLKSRAVNRIEDEEREVYSFRPQLNEKSREIDAQLRGTAEDFEGRHAMWQKKQYKAEVEKKKLQDELENEKMKECTFSPQRMGSKASISHGGLNVSDGGGSTEERPRRSLQKFYEQQLKWMAQKEERAAIQREALGEKELEGCTFHPQTYSERGASQSSFTSMLASSGRKDPGAENPFEALLKEYNVRGTMLGGSHDGTHDDAGVSDFVGSESGSVQKHSSMQRSPGTATANSMESSAEEGDTTAEWLKRTLGQNRELAHMWNSMQNTHDE